VARNIVAISGKNVKDWGKLGKNKSVYINGEKEAYSCTETTDSDEMFWVTASEF
jgi:hypothetical protein